MKKVIILLVCMCAVLSIQAKKEPVKIFPRSYGYYTKGDNGTKTITYDKGYGRFGWNNKGFKTDLSAYTHMVLEIEPTDSRVELHIVYDNGGDGEEDIKLGQINLGKNQLKVEFDGMRKIKTIYLTKSKPGTVTVVDFYVTDGQDGNE